MAPSKGHASIETGKLPISLDPAKLMAHGLERGAHSKRHLGPQSNELPVSGYVVNNRN